MINIKQIFFYIALFLSLWCCQNNNEINPKKQKTHIQEEENIKDLLSLPFNKYSKNKIDKEDFYTISLDSSIKSQLKYYDYYFDTTVNSSTFQFYYHCIGGENSESVNKRFLNEINEHFGVMIKSSQDERHIYYSSLCDSLVEDNGKFLYKRFQLISLGGQSLCRSEYFKFSTLKDFYSTINYENNSVKDQSSMQSRLIKEIIWM